MAYIKLRRMRVDSIRMYLREPHCVFVAPSDSTSTSYCLVNVVFPLNPQTFISFRSNDRHVTELIFHVWPFKWQFSTVVRALYNLIPTVEQGSPVWENDCTLNGMSLLSIIKGKCGLL